MARPSKYTEALGDKVCEGLSEGKSLSSVCKPAAMPHARTVYRWLRDNEAFCQTYETAKQEAADTLAEEIIDIADGVDKSGDTQRDRLRVDARKWVASKLKPKKYGDKVDHKHTGTVGVKLTTNVE